MMNSNISLNDIIFNNDIKSLRNINNKFLNNLSSNNGTCTIETVNLLQQANKTIINVNKLLKDNEIVDSATLMRSCIEKIAMAMMIYFDPENTYEEFKKMKSCGKTENTRPGNLVRKFSGKLNEISPLMFDEFSSKELCEMLNESYEKLCLYTHSSLAVSLMIEIDKNDDADLFIVFFYQMLVFLEILLYCCLKYLCNDKKEHIRIITNVLINCGLAFSKINQAKFNPEYLSKYKEYLYWDINYDFNDRYKNLLEKFKEDLNELITLINENKDIINDYLTS